MSAIDNRYSRQELLPVIGPAGQSKLKKGSVAIIGCGALGSVLADLLARAGVGRIAVIDRDVPERNNLQRQTLFDERDVEAGLPKAEAAARKLRRINSEIEVTGSVVDFTHRNAESLTDGADLLLDGSDNLETRFLINDLAISRAIPWIYGGVIGTSGMTMAIVPGEGPCLRCLLPEQPPAGSLPTCDTQGVLGSAPAVVASFQVTEALKILTGAEPKRSLLSIDLWSRSFKEIEVGANAACPVCSERRFDYLDGRSVSWIASMCGRNAIQITPPGEVTMPLERLQAELASAGRADFNGHILRFHVDDYDIILFSDGRAIVKGTTDEVVARSLYARYLGN